MNNIASRYRRNRFFFLLIVFMGLSVLFCSDALAGSCEEAVRLYNHASDTEDIPERERLLTSALTLNCEDKKIVAKIRNNLADSYEKQGKIEEAIAEYGRASELDPLLPTPYKSLGDIYFKRGEYEYAIDFYEKGLQFKEDSLSRINLDKARKMVPFYKSKREIVESLSLASRTRSILTVPSINLYFGFSQAKVTEQGKKQLQTVLNALKDNELRLHRFRLIGHTCDIGSDEYNQKLSVQRAEAVRHWLVSHGYPRDCLETIGYGEKKPLDTQKTEEARERNRRVEIRTTRCSIIQTRSSDPALAKGMKIFHEGESLLKALKYPEAKLKFESALQIFKENSYTEGVRSTAGNLYLIYLELGETDEAAMALHDFNENRS